MAEAISKVGIIACSGEEIPEGTISRLATRRVLEVLRPQQTVTLCLPLFLAGEERERRFAREHPTITVDGCDKLCAKRGTEQYSGQVVASLVVSDILGDRAQGCHRSARDADQADEQAVWIVAERIAAEVDALTASGARGEASEARGRRRVLCLRQPVAGRHARSRRQDGHGQRPAVDLRASRKEGPATRQRLGRHVAGDGANLSRDRTGRRSGLPPGFGRGLRAVLPAAT